jgi:hypothetical protein
MKKNASFFNITTKNDELFLLKKMHHFLINNKKMILKIKKIINTIYFYKIIIQ